MAVDPANLDVAAILGDVADASIEQLAAVANVADDSVEIREPEEPHIKIEARALMFNLKVFATMNKSLQDVLARACLFEINEQGCTATMSDGIFLGRVAIPLVSTKGEFPKSFTLDYDSLVKVAGLAGRFLYLVYVDKTFYVDFFGGRIHIPSYDNVKPELIKGRVECSAPVAEQVKDVSPVDLLQYLKIAENFLASNQLPNLAFAFMTPAGMFMSNGYTVMKGAYNFPFTCSIRMNDIPFLSALCQISLSEPIKVAQVKEKFIFMSPQAMVVLPAVNEAFPSSYQSHLSSFSGNDKYTVDFAKLVLLLTMLSKVYRSSNVVMLTSKDKELTMSSKSQDEKLSYMTLSRVATGEPQDAALSFSVPGLLNVMRALKTFKHLDLAFAGQTFCLSNDRVTLVVFGTGSDVKTHVFKMRKEAMKAGTGGKK